MRKRHADHHGLEENDGKLPFFSTAGPSADVNGRSSTVRGERLLDLTLLEELAITAPARLAGTERKPFRFESESDRWSPASGSWDSVSSCEESADSAMTGGAGIVSKLRLNASWNLE